MTAMDPEAEALPDAPIPGLTTVSANEHGPSGAVPAADECPPEDVTALELLRFTLPVLTAALSAEIMSVVDTAVVGTLGPQQLAALGPATMLSDSTVYLFFWLNVACTNLFATHFARGEQNDAFAVPTAVREGSVECSCRRAPGRLRRAERRTVREPGLRRAACRGAVVGRRRGARSDLCDGARRSAWREAVFGAIRILGVLALLTEEGSEKLRGLFLQAIRILGVPALMTATVLQGACTGMKDATTPFIAIVLGGLLNLALDLWLVLGCGMGIAGAASATVVSQAAQRCCCCSNGEGCSLLLPALPRRWSRCSSSQSSSSASAAASCLASPRRPCCSGLRRPPASSISSRLLDQSSACSSARPSCCPRCRWTVSEPSLRRT